MNPLTIVITILCGAALIYLGSASFIGRHMARKFAKPRTRSLEYTYEKGLEAEEFTPEFFEMISENRFFIDSDLGYRIHGVYYAGTDPKKTAVFVHGHTWSWHGMLKFVSIYLGLGFNIVAYNQRYHGDSGGTCCTAGYYEKRDLNQIIDWAYRQFPATTTLGLVGESMGAATVLQHMAIDSRATFIHADCPYSNVGDLYSHQLKLHHIPQFMRSMTLLFCDRYLKRHCSFSLHDIDPAAAAAASATPLFLAHGTADTYVPTYMSRAIAEKRSPEADTYLYLADNAVHAKALPEDPAAYRRELFRFLDAYVDIPDISAASI